MATFARRERLLTLVMNDTMKKILRIAAVVVLGLSAIACSSVKKMAQEAENVIVECNPSPLEVVAGNIDAFVAVTYPAGYFHPKAILEVTPVLVYEGGEQAMAPFYYQGEKVKDNYKVVPSAGTTVSERVHFTYIPGMERSHLELRGVATLKASSVTLPTKKVADGANTTYMLVKRQGLVPLKDDGYQEIIKQTEEGQILYAINSSDVRSNELRSQSIRSFQAALDEIKANDRATVTGTEVVAYASPDGGAKLNANLSENRSKSAEKAWNTVTKGRETEAPEVRSIGQDWEGFQELVSRSNIPDKDLILRVLSMYSDPAVRESEIKNMSEIYKELKDGVLPELRRARFIANVEYKNFTAEELVALIDDNIDVLDETALLRAATLVDDTAKQISIYNKAIEKFDSDVARFNTGVVYLNEGKDAQAKAAFDKVKTNDADLKNARGVLALHDNDLATASRLFNESGTACAKANQGIIDILQGNYAKAAAELVDAPGCCHNTVLAYILTNQLDKAAATVSCQDPKVKYLQAIIAARKGNASEYRTFLAAANQNAELRERAAKDIEFAAFR